MHGTDWSFDILSCVLSIWPHYRWINQHLAGFGFQPLSMLCLPFFICTVSKLLLSTAKTKSHFHINNSTPVFSHVCVYLFLLQHLPGFQLFANFPFKLNSLHGISTTMNYAMLTSLLESSLLQKHHTLQCAKGHEVSTLQKLIAEFSWTVWVGFKTDFVHYIWFENVVRSFFKWEVLQLMWIGAWCDFFSLD